MLRQLNETRLNEILKPSKKGANMAFDLKFNDEEKLYNFKAIIRPHPTSQGVAQWEKTL